MAIKVIEEPDVHISRSEMEYLMPEYRNSQRFTTQPVSFETWLRQHQRRTEQGYHVHD